MTEEKTKHKTEINKNFIKDIQGNSFVLHEGLLNAFHENGGNSINTELVPNEKTIIFKATVSGDWGTFSGHGDADESNVGAMIKQHKIRMAETRAINRALRFYNNVGMCSADELGGDDKPKPKAATFGKDVKVPNVCSECKKEITDKVKEFSIDKFKKTLCYDCQQKQ